jgi:hypothetical protein
VARSEEGFFYFCFLLVFFAMDGSRELKPVILNNSDDTIFDKIRSTAFPPIGELERDKPDVIREM